MRRARDGAGASAPDHSGQARTLPSRFSGRADAIVAPRAADHSPASRLPPLTALISRCARSVRYGFEPHELRAQSLKLRVQVCRGALERGDALLAVAFEHVHAGRILLPVLREFGVQSLDCRQRHAVGVDRAYAGGIGAEAEFGREVLRHRPHVAYRSALRDIAPCRKRQGGDMVEHRAQIDRLDRHFRVAVGERTPRAVAGREIDAQVQPGDVGTDEYRAVLEERRTPRLGAAIELVDVQLRVVGLAGIADAEQDPGIVHRALLEPELGIVLRHRFGSDRHLDRGIERRRVQAETTAGADQELVAAAGMELAAVVIGPDEGALVARERRRQRGAGAALKRIAAGGGAGSDLRAGAAGPTAVATGTVAAAADTARLAGRFVLEPAEHTGEFTLGEVDRAAHDAGVVARGLVAFATADHRATPLRLVLRTAGDRRERALVGRAVVESGAVGGAAADRSVQAVHAIGTDHRGDFGIGVAAGTATGDRGAVHRSVHAIAVVSGNHVRAGRGGLVARHPQTIGAQFQWLVVGGAEIVRAADRAAVAAGVPADPGERRLGPDRLARRQGLKHPIAAGHLHLQPQ